MERAGDREGGTSGAPAAVQATGQRSAAGVGGDRLGGVDDRPACAGTEGPDAAAAVAAREEERSVLEAIYGDEFEVISDSEWKIDLPGPPNAPAAALHILLPAGYPRCEAAPVPVVNCDCTSEVFHAAAAVAVQELLAEWLPSDEGCLYQWAERLREAVRPALEDAAGAVAAEAAQREELDLAVAQAAAAAEEEEAARGSFTYLPANPQYGQRRRNFDGASLDPANAVEVRQGDPFTDRKSTFQAHAARVSSQDQVQWVLRKLLDDRKIAVATHNIFAYRFHDAARGVLIADNDDDGEDTAGTKLAELLSLTGCEDVFVMVSRWYGGIQLGPDRFKHICRAASTLLDTSGFSKRPRGAGGAGGKSRAAGNARK